LLWGSDPADLGMGQAVTRGGWTGLCVRGRRCLRRGRAGGFFDVAGASVLHARAVAHGEDPERQETTRSGHNGNHQRRAPFGASAGWFCWPALATRCHHTGFKELSAQQSCHLYLGSLQLLVPLKTGAVRSAPHILLPARFGLSLKCWFRSAKYASIAVLPSSTDP